jgi:CRISPR-associated protein Csm2
MANNNYNNQNNYRQNNNNQNNQKFTPKVEAEKVEWGKVEMDFGEEAKKLMKKTSTYITNSQLRNILSLFSHIYDKQLRLNSADGKLDVDTIDAMKYAKIKIVYAQAKSEYKSKRFYEQSNIINFVDEAIKNRKNLILFFRYIEALVAYHKLFGGKN